MKVFISESLLLEATAKYVKKIIDPALMTWEEFHDKIINPSNRWHESSAYSRDNNYEYAESHKDDEDGYMNIKSYPILINNITINGKLFQVRKRKTKRLYALVDENGNNIYDKNGRALTMNDTERKALRYPEFYYEIGIFDENGVLISSALNEWGALLVTTVDEFKGWGFAKIVIDEYRKEHPDADSGGFTNAGLHTTQNYYFDLVRKYLASGFYSHLIRQGHITKEKVKQIISKLPDKSPQKKPKDLNFNDPKDILVIDLDNGEFILYNQKIIPLILSEKDSTDHFVREGLLGHVRPMFIETKQIFRLHLFFARNAKIKAALNLLMASYLHDEKLCIIDNDMYNMFEKHIDKSLYNISNNKACAKASHINYKNLNRQEQEKRLKLCNGDKFEAEEVYTLITELAYILSED